MQHDKTRLYQIHDVKSTISGFLHREELRSQLGMLLFSLHPDASVMSSSMTAKRSKISEITENGHADTIHNRLHSLPLSLQMPCMFKGPGPGGEQKCCFSSLLTATKKLPKCL